MGIPTVSSESFDLLVKKSIIPEELGERLKKMVHFRNIVVHDYRKIDIDIVKSVIGSNLDDLIRFTEIILPSGKS